jgi:hypothetical protein
MERVGRATPEALILEPEGRRPEAGTWLPLCGGELEAPPPRRLCPGCLVKASTAAARPVLCFECHRAERERQRSLRAAAELNTASEARFQEALPFERVNTPRLAMLRLERAQSRAAMQSGMGRFDARRRKAIIAARGALRQWIGGVRARGAAKPEERRALAMAMHAAELQLPEAWLPFVISR